MVEHLGKRCYTSVESTAHISILAQSLGLLERQEVTQHTGKEVQKAKMENYYPLIHGTFETTYVHTRTLNKQNFGVDLKPSIFLIFTLAILVKSPFPDISFCPQCPDFDL